MYPSLHRLLRLPVSLLLVYSFASSQDLKNLSSVAVEVTDVSGAEVPNAQIKFLGLSTKSESVCSSDSAGKAMCAITPGAYTASVSVLGFRTSTQHLDAKAGQNGTIRFVLNVQSCPPGCVQVISSEPPLATLTAHVDRTVYNGGEHIHVTLTLRAGTRGAYVSKWSKVPPTDKQNPLVGRHISNVSGFDVSLLTLDGKNAETLDHAGVADRLGPAPPPSARFKEEFLFLKPDEEESWLGIIEGTPVTAGE